MFKITFSYVIEVEEGDEQKAVAEAKKVWDEITPRTDEMNIDVRRRIK